MTQSSVRIPFGAPFPDEIIGEMVRYAAKYNLNGKLIKDLTKNKISKQTKN